MQCSSIPRAWYGLDIATRANAWDRYALSDRPARSPISGLRREQRNGARMRVFSHCASCARTRDGTFSPAGEICKMKEK